MFDSRQGKLHLWPFSVPDFQSNPYLARTMHWCRESKIPFLPSILLNTTIWPPHMNRSNMLNQNLNWMILIVRAEFFQAARRKHGFQRGNHLNFPASHAWPEGRGGWSISGLRMISHDLPHWNGTWWLDDFGHKKPWTHTDLPQQEGHHSGRGWTCQDLAGAAELQPQPPPNSGNHGHHGACLAYLSTTQFFFFPSKVSRVQQFSGPGAVQRYLVDSWPWRQLHGWHRRAGWARPRNTIHPPAQRTTREGRCLGHSAGESLHSADRTSVAPKVFGEILLEILLEPGLFQVVDGHGAHLLGII